MNIDDDKSEMEPGDEDPQAGDEGLDTLDASDTLNEDDDSEETTLIIGGKVSEGGANARKSDAYSRGMDDKIPEDRGFGRSDARTAEEFLLQQLPGRAASANERLRANLAGNILIEITSTGKKYLFDGGAQTPKVESTDKNTGDCSIRLNEDSLLRIAQGDLNPQVGMLSDKIAVDGKLGLAIYFFNLVSPRTGF